jgi:PDZ domain-containing protein
MASSQQNATAAALCQLGIKFAVIDSVSNTVKGLPAARMLRPGDQIVAVNSQPVNCRQTAQSLIFLIPVGQRMVLTVRRSGRTLQIPIAKVSYHGIGVIGVNLAESYAFPFTVRINIGDVGGPSAGMMFALGIIDKLTPANLTGGRFIAGTGEISVNGAVGPIGGIQQKMAAARAAGATVFLTPATNCPDTAGAVPPGLRLVKVSTLAGAIAALDALKAGLPVPSC